MAAQHIPTCCEATADNYTSTQLFTFLYCLVYQINENTGGGTAPGAGSNYTSVPITATGNGSIPAGVLGWSVTAVSGTVTVNGQALAVGGSFRGGGYGAGVSNAAIDYTVAGGSALVSYDLPA